MTEQHEQAMQCALTWLGRVATDPVANMRNATVCIVAVDLANLAVHAKYPELGNYRSIVKPSHKRDRVVQDLIRCGHLRPDGSVPL
jgi:hypothetical protein